MRRLWLLCFLVLLVPMQLGTTYFYSECDSTNRCNLTPGQTCCYTFASTDTTTTADSPYYSVKKCQTLSYSCYGDGTADFLVYEYLLPDGTGGNVWTSDMDNDGDVDAVDEGITFDCSGGKREIRALPVGKPYQKIDVQTVPSSGTAYVTVRCNGGD